MLWTSTRYEEDQEQIVSFAIVSWHSSSSLVSSVAYAQWQAAYAWFSIALSCMYKTCHDSHVHSAWLQVVIFVKSVPRAKELNRLLNECNFPSVCIHRGMQQVRLMA